MGERIFIHAPSTPLNHTTSQFYDLIEIFRIGGYAPHTNYLFLGMCRPNTTTR